MAVIEILKDAAVISGYLTQIFPIAYIIFRRGQNKFLYVSSCIGALIISIVLLVGVTIPYLLFITKVVPVLAEFGYVKYISSLLIGVEGLWGHSTTILIPILNIALPILIYKRYPMFHLTSRSRPFA